MESRRRRRRGSSPETFGARRDGHDLRLRVATPTPGFRRAIADLPILALAWPADRSTAEPCVLADRNANVSGITPMMVRATPLTRSVWPATSEAPPKRSRQSRCPISITGSAPGRSSPSRNPRPRMGGTPNASNAATVSSPPLSRSGRPSTFDKFRGASPNAPIFSKEACPCWNTARSWTLMGWSGCRCEGVAATIDTMRSESGNGRPLNRPPLTTQNTVVLRPMPSPSVSTATSDSAGYRTSIRTPERMSASSVSIVTRDAIRRPPVRGKR